MEDKIKVNYLDDGDNITLSMVDEAGNEILYNVILTFDSADFDKSYLLMVPAETPADDDETVEVLAYAFTKKDDDTIDELIPVESDEEWDMIEEVFNTSFEDDFDDFDDEE